MVQWAMSNRREIDMGEVLEYRRREDLSFAQIALRMVIPLRTLELRWHEYCVKMDKERRESDEEDAREMLRNGPPDKPEHFAVEYTLEIRSEPELFEDRTATDAIWNADKSLSKKR